MNCLKTTAPPILTDPVLRRSALRIIGIGLLSLGLFGVALPSADGADPERRALGRYAGNYKGQFRSFLTRKTITGAVSSFIPTSQASARIPRGKRGFRIETEFAFRIIFFGRIKQISVRNNGAKVKYRGMIQGFTSFPGGGTVTSPGSGSFKATARTRGNREKLDGKLKAFDPGGGNTITTRFVGKQ